MTQQRAHQRNNKDTVATHPQRSPSDSRSDYRAASKFYGQQAKKTQETPRQIEARALLKAARFLADIQNRFEQIQFHELETALKINRHIWIAFFEKASSSESSDKYSLNDNVVTLSSFVFKRSLDILTNPAADKLSALITINREVATGLLTQK